MHGGSLTGNNNLSMGTRENIENFRNVNAALDAAGIKHVAYNPAL